MSGAWVIERYVFLLYVEMLYMDYLRCGNCAFSGGFVRECTDVSLSDLAGEGVELTVHKESVVVEEIKEVELRSRGAHLFMAQIKIELGHAVVHVAHFR